MSFFKVTTDRAAFGRKLDQSIKRFPRAAAAGINKAVRGVSTLAVREIQLEVGASAQKTIRRSIKLLTATKEKPEARLIVSSSGEKMRFFSGDTAVPGRIPIYELRPKPKTRPTGRPRGSGVSYGPTQKLLSGSFIATLKSGHVGVFTRIKNRNIIGDIGFIDIGKGASIFMPPKTRSRKKEPITELFGPSPALIFSRKKITDKIRAYVREKVPQEINRAFRFMAG